MPHWSFHVAWIDIPTMPDIATLLLDTATSACRTSECPQTFDVKGLTYKRVIVSRL